MSFFSYFCSEVYFVLNKYCYLSFCFFSFIPLISICVSFNLMWIFCRQHINWSCFLIHSANLCLFTEVFNHFSKKKSHDHTNRCRKAFDKIQSPFLIKTLSKVGIEETYLNIYYKPAANIILNGE